jgi:hypothetical protein
MATTTPNYGWPVPTSTDLVKDGATAIESLGDAIDATLFAQAPGLVLINTTSFSAVTSVSLATSTFTSTYDNYKILFRLSASGGTGYVQMRLRAAGTDNTTSNYASSGVGRGTNGTAQSFEGNAESLWYLVPKSTGDTVGVSMDLYSPKLTNNTLFTASVEGNFSGVTASYNVGGIFGATTSFDSLTFVSSSSTITGTYSVFAYKK